MIFDTSEQEFSIFEPQKPEEGLSIKPYGPAEIVKPLEMSHQSSEDEMIIPDSAQFNSQIEEKASQETNHNTSKTDEVMLSGSFDSVFDPLINDNLSEPRNANEVINGLLTLIPSTSSQEMLLNRDDPTIIRQQLVEINFGLLDTAADQPSQGESFQLNLFDGISYTVNFGAAQTSSDGESFVRVGKVEEMPLSEVTLVSDKDENVVVANIRVADPLQQQDEFYQIRYEGNGLHTIREIDSSQFPECPNCGGQHPASLHQDFVISSEPEDIDPNAPIPLGVDTSDLGINGIGVADAQTAEAEMDVMVVYTPAARDDAGGTTGINNLITLAETETNQGYQNSQVNQRVNIVHREEVDYTETESNPMGNALDAVRSRTRGDIDHIHDLRNIHSADFVSFWIDTPGSCGIAYVMGSPSIRFHDLAFSVVDTDCATGNYTFAHELGHNQGSQHNIENAGSARAYFYSFGYRDTASPNRFRTIMSYGDGSGLTRINYWSNPNVDYNGEVTGTSDANNALSLNNSAPYASWWRVSNDNFAKAKQLNGSSASGYAFTQMATQESDEPSHAGNSGGKSAWWKWIAPSSGSFRVDTNGSDFNTTLGIYTGSSVSSLSTIASDDDGGSGTNSQVTFNATAGTTYYIAIDGYNGAFGNASLNLTAASTPTDVDLSGASFNVIQEPLDAGDSFDVEFEIQNTEAGNANGFSADFYLSTDATIDNSADSNDILLGSQWISILTGNSSTGILSDSLTLPSAFSSFWNGSGTYYIGMIADASGSVEETDETNNASTGESIDYESIEITVNISDDNYEENDDIATASTVLSASEETWLSSIDGEGVANDDDYYAIEVNADNTDLSVDLQFIDADGDIDLQLLDSTGSVLSRSTSVTDNESIEYTVATAGTYYLQVYPYGTPTSNTYDLYWDGIEPDDNYEENDDIATASTVLRTSEQTWLTSIDGLGIANDDDYYAIEVTADNANLLVNLEFIDADGDIDIELLDSTGSVLRSSTSITDNESIEYAGATAGTYYLRVYPYGTPTSNTYDLSWDGIEPPVIDDNYEENDDIATASTVLRTSEQTWLNSIDGLGIANDDDYYAIEVNADNTDLSVDLQFTHAEGDIDLQLLDSTGAMLSYSNSVTDNESIEYTVATAGTYYLQVYPYGIPTSNTYDLSWDGVSISGNTVDNDFDGDGLADIHWRNGDQNQIWLMDGTTVTTSGNPSNTSSNAEGNGDFNGDGQADLLFSDGNQYEIWEMNGTTEVNTYRFTALNSNWSVVGIGDTDGDGDDDILVRNGSKNRILEIDNFGLDQVVTLNNYNSSWSVAGMGDTDGDGDDDILWRKGNANRLWKIEDNSRVSVNNIGGFNSSWSVVGMGDTDGDGDDDILWRKGNANRLWEMEDNSRASVNNIGGFNSNWQVEDVEDYDGDGDDDILWRNGNKNRIWQMASNSRASNSNTNSLDSVWNVIA